MSKIKIEHLNEQQRLSRQIPDQPQAQGPWAVWECAASAFDWHYDMTEEAYIYEGRVKVRSQDEEVMIKAGDFVTFPKGMDCRWEVFETVRKVYQFIK